jgi:predicted nucleic acid-binding protein
MRFMNAKVFVDTNVLVYAHDNKEGHKQEAAKRILRALSQQRSGAVSMQVLQEFYSTVTRKLAPPLLREEARAIVEDFALWCIATTLEEIKQAFQHRGRGSDQLLGCDDYCRGNQERRNTDSLRRSEPRTNYCRNSDRESLRTSVKNARKNRSDAPHSIQLELSRLLSSTQAPGTTHPGSPAEVSDR